MAAARAQFWTRLPPELKQMVLGVLIRAAQQNGASLAPYAAVCAEWQAAIEAVTFRSLKLTPARLGIPGFVDMVNRGGELGLVHHVGLFIPMAEYNCPQCDDFRSEDLETQADFQDDMASIEDSLRATFRLLSKWKRKGDLSLDITVQSPSDSRHHFRHIDVDGCSQATAGAVHDPRHGWRKGMRISWPPEGAFNRLFMDIALHPEFWRTLPQVAAVTGLCLRRQTTRRWHPGAVRELVKHLGGLQELHYEPWREWVLESRMETDMNTQELLLGSLRHTAGDLSRLVLFEDFSEAYTSSFVVYSPYGIPRWHSAQEVRTPSREVTTALASAGARLPHLEHLSAAFLVDAKDFFPVVRRAGTGDWSKLTSLALTSLFLTPAHSRATINNLLEQAALAAARLPALSLMEVWNGRKALACVLRYQAAAPPPPSSLGTSSSSPVAQYRQVASARLTWRATWSVELEPRVVEAWERVACGRQRSCALEVVRDILGAGIRVSIGSHGDAIRHLGFSHHVLRPVSLS